jgi:hypothetical protein
MSETIHSIPLHAFMACTGTFPIFTIRPFTAIHRIQVNTLYITKVYGPNLDRSTDIPAVQMAAYRSFPVTIAWSRAGQRTTALLTMNIVHMHKLYN